MKKMRVIYNPVNEDNTFSSGDVIAGQIILELSKETTINCLAIKAKGDANVRWSEGSGDDETTYSAHERYFKLKQFLIHSGKDKGKDYELLMGQSGKTYPNVVPPGTHVYPFTFQIPQGDMPSSFKGIHGKIVYSLEAKLSRSMRLQKTAMAEFTFLSKLDQIKPQLMEPWTGSVEKKMKLFTSGKVSISVHIEKTGYIPGETLNVVAEIENNSSRALAPKFALHEQQTFTASSSKTSSSKKLFKEVGERIPPSTRQRVSRVLRIPPDATASIFHCSIIKVEHILQVYLDVPYAKDPTVKVPLTILPKTSETEMLMWSEAYRDNTQAGWNSYPPPTAPGGYLSHTAPGGYPPQGAAGGYLLKTNPGPPLK